MSATGQIDDGLFRTEVLESRADRLHGTVRIAIPLRWHAISMLLLALLVLAVAFMARATYPRTVVAQGRIAIAQGAAGIVATRQGVVQALLVRPGARVSRGQPLAQIDTQLRSAAVEGDYEQRLRALRDQNAALAQQAELLQRAGEEERGRAAAELRSLGEQAASLAGQMQAQQRLVSLAEQEFDNARHVAERGFVSRRDLSQREGNVLSSRQQLLQLRQERARVNGSMEAISRSMRQTTASAGAQVAAVRSGQADLARQAASNEAEQAYKLVAPVDGIVTVMTARVGQTVGPDQALLTIVPSDARLRVELQVGTAAIGFVREGLPVRLAVDAFPYQRYGMVAARVSEVALTATPQVSPDGSTGPVYLVSAELDRAHMEVAGTLTPLRPGMGVTARIIAERRNLFEWLFEPLLSLGRR